MTQEDLNDLISKNPSPEGIANNYSSEELLLKAENVALRAVLDELLTVKYIRDSEGHTPEYMERKPKAWEEAKKVFNNLYK